MRRVLASLAAALVALPGCSFTRADPARGVTLEVAVFEGGYGLDWHRQVARDYEKQNPGIKVDIWGDPRVDEKVRPRVLRGDPPDAVNCTLPVWKLILAGKLYPLDEALDSDSYDKPGITWRESLIPGLLSNFEYQRNTYAMPSNFSMWVCWYNRALFRNHGWQPPKTWSEFTALCEKARQAGIAPLAFQGKYPYYAWATLLSLYQRLVPFEEWYELQDFKPGAFVRPDMIKAATMLQDMSRKHFQQGALAMTHTESQMEWVNGRAAMVFCGLWLKNEMKKALPPDFEMDCFPVPPIEGGKGDPKAVYGGGGENFYVFKDARHPREAADFLKFMVSETNALPFMNQIESLTTVKLRPEIVSQIPRDLQTPVRIMLDSTRSYSDRLTGLFPTWNKSVLEPTLGELVASKLTPEQACRRLEAGLEAIRRDPEIYKPPQMGVPPM